VLPGTFGEGIRTSSRSVAPTKQPDYWILLLVLTSDSLYRYLHSHHSVAISASFSVPISGFAKRSGSLFERPHACLCKRLRQGSRVCQTRRKESVSARRANAPDTLEPCIGKWAPESKNPADQFWISLRSRRPIGSLATQSCHELDPFGYLCGANGDPDSPCLPH
jgi:hypothetical protein